jgi:ketosteroid isomerase-like protein
LPLHEEDSVSKLLSLLCSILILVVAAVSVARADPAADATAAYAAWDAAFNSGSARAVCALYTDDAILLPPTHDVIKGPEAVDKFIAGILGMGAKGHKFELIEASGDGKVVYAAAKWSATGKDSAGSDQPWGGLSTTIFEKQADGSLKIKMQTFN